MQALAPDPTERPAVRRVVLALERAQARLVAAAGRHAPRVNVSVSPWRVAAASLGLVMLGFWTTLRRTQGRRGSPSD